MTDEQLDNAGDQVLEACMNRMLEYFDGVRIFVNRYDPVEDRTMSQTCGRGNWNAMRGQIADWMIREDTKVSNSVSED